jgi:hypothetical protein
MQSTDATRGHGSDLSDHFWDRYVESLQAKRVKPTAVRWYVIRAEQYLQAVARQRLAEHTPQDVADYLEKLDVCFISSLPVMQQPACKV